MLQVGPEICNVKTCEQQHCRDKQSCERALTPIPIATGMIELLELVEQTLKEVNDRNNLFYEERDARFRSMLLKQDPTLLRLMMVHLMIIHRMGLMKAGIITDTHSPDSSFKKEDILHIRV